ncbi:MAG: hypothetical protein ACQES9_08005 [Myxococcota bacterium]
MNNKNWFYIHPHVKALWLNRLGKTSNLHIAGILSTIIENVDAHKLIESGAVSYIDFTCNPTQLHSNETALLASGQKDLLHKIALEKEELGLESPNIYEACLHLTTGEYRRVRQTILKIINMEKHLDKNHLLALKTAKADEQTIHKLLDKMVSDSYETIDLLDCAKLYYFIFQDQKKALNLLKHAAKQAYCTEDYIECARCFIHLADDMEAGQKYRHKAISEKDPYFWFVLARLSKIYCNEDMVVIRCLRIAEKLPEYYTPNECASEWINLLNLKKKVDRCYNALLEPETFEEALDYCRNYHHLTDKINISRIYLNEAEELVSHPFNYYQLAQYWKDYCHDPDKAQESLLKYEEFCLDPENFCTAAKGWTTISDNKKATVRCLSIAQDEAKNNENWLQVAKYWVELLDYKPQARFCLEKMLEKKTSNLKYIEAAKLSIRYLKDKQTARHYFEQAEKCSKNPVHWIRNAHFSYSFLKMPQRARNCLLSGEKVVMRRKNWSQLAQTWLELFTDKNRALKCMKQLEKTNFEFYDWLETAEYYHDIFNDKIQMQLCFKQARNLAETTSEINTILEKEQDFIVTPQNFKNNLLQLQNTASTCGEFLSLARAWNKTTDNNEKIEFCLNKAGELAEIGWDHKELALAWTELGNNKKAIKHRALAQELDPGTSWEDLENTNDEPRWFADDILFNDEENPEPDD